MKTILKTVLCIGLCSGCQAPQILTQNAPVEGVLIQNVTLVSAERDGVRAHMDVWVREGVIVEIGKNLPEAVRTIDGSGKFLTPGLIDGHTHLSEVPGMSEEHEAAFPEIAKAARAQIPRSYLYHGFTTLVDLNASAQVIGRWNTELLHPHAYFCGIAPVFDGYPTQFVPKSIRYKVVPNFLYDDARADEFPEGVDPAEHSPEAVVARIKADGAICVKTHYESGFGGRGNWPVPSVNLVQNLVATAHAQGLPVLLHANSQSAQAFGVAAGVDAFAHGMWTWDDKTWDDRQATVVNDEVKQILDGAIAKGIGMQPTVQVLYGEQDLQDPDYLARPELKSVLPQNLIDWYGTEDGKWWQAIIRRNNPVVKPAVDAGRWDELDAAPIARVLAVTEYLDTHGGRLLFGSDTPSEPTYANPAGLNGRLEMQSWIKAGVAPETLFRALTLGNAEFFGLEKMLGSLEVGKRADLLLMAKNPLTGVEAYDSIELVVVEGRVVARVDLAAR